MTNSSVGVIEFRNGIYQGNKTNSHPEGLGLFLDDNMALHCSEWKKLKYNGHTAILMDHGKYIYGKWENGVPHGFNVFREGEIVLLGNFKEGRTDGQFAIIFERHKFVVIGYPTQNTFVVESRREFENQEDLRKLILRAIDNFTEDYFSFVRYLNSHFCGEQSGLTLELDIDTYRFGFLNGLAVIFDDQNYISKIGQIGQDNKLFGLGVLYANQTQAGNYDNQYIIRYEPKMKPVEDLKRLFKIQHKRSINFKNDYILTKKAEVIISLEKIIKMSIECVVSNAGGTPNQFSKKQLDDSLQMRHRPDTGENQRLKMIREQLYKSIGLNGVKPSANELKYLSNYPAEMREYYYNKHIPSGEDSLNPISSELKKELRSQFLKQNRLNDYRFRQIHLPLTNLRLKHSYIPQSIEQHIDYQSTKNRNQNSNSKNSPKKKIREGSFSPSPIYSAKDTAKNSPSKSIKEFKVSIDPSQSNQFSAYNSFNPKQHHTNVRVEELIEQIVNSDVRKYQSPYKRHALDSIRDGSSRMNLPVNFSRTNIPISHEVKIRQSSSPQKPIKEKQTNHKLHQTPNSKLLPIERAGRSYLEIFRTGTSPNILAETDALKPKHSRSPTPNKKPKQNKPLRRETENNNLFQRRKDNHNIQSLEDKNRMIEQISKKYNYANSH